MNTVVKFPTRVNPWESILNDVFAPANSVKTFNPATNITEKEDGYHIAVVVPGFNKNNIKVTAENDLLAIKGQLGEQTATANEKVVRKDFELLAFEKSFNLDGKVNTENIAAKYEDGILNVWLPKLVQAPKFVKEVAIN